MNCLCHEYQHLLMDSKQVLKLLENASANKQSFSLTRFSHAEISYLSWNINPHLMKAIDPYRNYNGMTGSVETVSDQLFHSLNRTDLVGLIPRDCQDNGEWWYYNTKQLLHYLDFIPEKICSVWATHDLIGDPQFWDFLKSFRVALVGRRAEEAKPYFAEKGVEITETKSLDGVQEIEPVREALKNSTNWEIAIVSAGIPATILTPDLAWDTGRVVIDFGHALY